MTNKIPQGIKYEERFERSQPFAVDRHGNTASHR